MVGRHGAAANFVANRDIRNVGDANRNAIHGSDSDENAKIEGDFMFSVLEQF